MFEKLIAMKRWLQRQDGLARMADVLLAPLVLPSSVLLRAIRKADLGRMPVSRWIFRTVGVLPIQNHYYEPLFHPASLSRPLNEVRSLPGIEINLDGQLELLRSMRYGAELERFGVGSRGDGRFHYDNGFFDAGDAEFLYSMIRRFRPARIVEIGSGYSTLIAQEAIDKNREEDRAYSCAHMCIEPYENPWLDKLPVEVVRQPVQAVEASRFTALGENDILFIDSSHVIRAQGDVLAEYLEILPSLQRGVLVHVHDIFTPRDYPRRWVLEEVRLWNEQYLLEAFLCMNRDFEVVAALNQLANDHPAELAMSCPVWASRPNALEPGSFWMRRVAGAG